jgi:acyl-CoA synthetase (AMP-forming)/AMP-acid ligase II/thioesterase domain-containing protein/acyl carrier protein
MRDAPPKKAASDALLDAPSTIQESTLDLLFRTASRGRLTAACILSADGQAMTWQQLLEQLTQTREALRSAGIGPDDRVALILPPGPTLATAFLSVASCTGCAPLNESYTEEEFNFYLGDLKTNALITRRGVAPAAESAAARLGIPVIECRDAGGAPGLFTLTGYHREGQPSCEAVGSETTALYLYTSGTTSKPKLVPLRHRNLLASASNIVSALDLSASDRCLDIMPLFHIHGLVGGLLAPLAGGGSVVCPPRLQPGQFFRWMEATRPTWYTAVPTMHRMVVSEAQANGDIIKRCPLRFIRSSSAPLPAHTFDQLTHLLQASVVEAYSMTEAAHQITCNPLGAGRQKKGSVGLPAGPEVTIMDETGRVLPEGETGEIVIRGPSVITAYQDNPEADVRAFVKGWFRTGDQGRFDANGYLVLTGRLKEQINRGGEKFAPLEVDQALLAHPDISDAATFAFPHPTLGQEVAAAVVMREGAQTKPREIQDFLRLRLAPFKIPRRIVVVSAIPKGATGKVQRSQLHEQLAVTKEDQRQPAITVEPANSDGLENTLLRLWREVLNMPTIGVDDDFFESGGDSLMAVQFILKLEEIVGHCVPHSILMEHPTVAQLASILLKGDALREQPLVVVQEGNSRAPLFFFHGALEGGYYTRRIAALLGPDQSLISIAPHGLVLEPIPDSIEAMALDRLPLVLEAQQEGPFRLAGYCNGGLVALSLATMLVERGRSVDSVFIIDTPTLNFNRAARRFFGTLTKGFETISPAWEKRAPLVAATIDSIWRQVSNLQVYRRNLGALTLLASKFITRRIDDDKYADLHRDVRSRERALTRIYTRLFRKYMPRKTEIPVVYFSAEHDGRHMLQLCPNIEIVNVPGGHWGCITTHLDVLANELRLRLHALDKHTASRDSASPA